jgi:hypothetical protein
MAVTLMLYLFGKPGVELNEGAEVTPKDLRDLGADLQARMNAAADIVEKLAGAGWEARLSLYDVMLSNPYVETAVQAEGRLLALGIDPDAVAIDEWPEEEEEFEEEFGGED